MELHILECLDALLFVRSQIQDPEDRKYRQGSGDQSFEGQVLTKISRLRDACKDDRKDCANNGTAKSTHKKDAKAEKKKDFDMSRLAGAHVAR
jgi:hypothetical protein